MQRIIIKQLEICRLLARYCCLRAEYIYLHIKLVAIKVGGAALIEAVQIQGWIKSMSNEQRVAIAAGVAVSSYVVLLSVLIRH